MQYDLNGRRVDISPLISTLAVLFITTILQYYGLFPTSQIYFHVYYLSGHDVNVTSNHTLTFTSRTFRVHLQYVSGPYLKT